MSWRFRIRMWLINRRNIKRNKAIAEEELCQFHADLKDGKIK